MKKRKTAAPSMEVLFEKYIEYAVLSSIEINMRFKNV